MSLRKLSLTFVVLLSYAAVGQNQPQFTPNTISVGADGKFEASPDTVLINFGISAQEATSSAALDHASRSAEQVRELLRKNGVDPKTAEVAQFSLDPVYDFRNPKRKLVGYRAGTSITLKLKDFQKVGPVTQGLADLDITDSQSLSYILDNIEEAKAKAAQDAFQHGRALAAAVAASASRAAGELVYASVDTFEAPRPVPYRVMAMAKENSAPPPEPTAEFSAQKVTVTAHVNAVFSLK